MGATLLASRRLEGGPCCVASCAASAFVVGTYTLDEAAGVRHGSVLFYHSSPDGIEEAGQVQAAGLFDLRWADGALACASSDGRLLLVSPPGDAAAPRITAHVSCAQDAMCTSVDWCGASQLAACGQDGRAHLIALREAGLELTSSWEAHSLEAWVVRSSGDALFSGADDACFKCWDIRAEPSQPVFSLSRAHAAGVCSVEVNPHCSHLVATGSYDEHVRLWDTRALATPILIQKLSCGGGVWRLAWHPSEQDTLLAACMQNGFAVLRGGELWQSYCPGAKEGEHGSLGYGVGWCQPAPGRFAAVTASFYDRSLHMCSFE